MGKGRKTKREMKRLVNAIKRKRLLKKSGFKTHVKPEDASNNE